MKTDDRPTGRCANCGHGGRNHYVEPLFDERSAPCWFVVSRRYEGDRVGKLCGCMEFATEKREVVA